MSRKEGALTICERCGKQLFLEKLGETVQDGGYTITGQYGKRPEGWELVTKPGGKGYMDVCPDCWGDYLRLLGKFWSDKKGGERP